LFIVVAPAYGNSWGKLPKTLFGAVKPGGRFKYNVSVMVYTSVFSFRFGVNFIILSGLKFLLWEKSGVQAVPMYWDFPWQNLHGRRCCNIPCKTA